MKTTYGAFPFRNGPYVVQPKLYTYNFVQNVHIFKNSVDKCTLVLYDKYKKKIQLVENNRKDEQKKKTENAKKHTESTKQTLAKSKMSF